MVSETNESCALTGSAAAAGREGSERFYARRNQVYTGLLLFVVVIGLPVVSVPSLRNRLSARVMAMKVAMKGNVKPVVAQVGANHEPLPAEYEKPAPVIPQAPHLPPLERVFTMKPGGSATPSVVPRESRPAPKVARILKTIPPPSAESEEPAGRAATGPAASAEPEIKYQQGKTEQSAYELLLKSNATIAGMVQGSNPSLHFKSWDAANRGDDVYWVRLKFQSEGNPDVEYIWQVKLQTNQVTPLSYNARTIS